MRTPKSYLRKQAFESMMANVEEPQPTNTSALPLRGPEHTVLECTHGQGPGIIYGSEDENVTIEGITVLRLGWHTIRQGYCEGTQRLGCQLAVGRFAAAAQALVEECAFPH